MQKMLEPPKVARSRRIWPGLVCSASLLVCAGAQAAIAPIGAGPRGAAVQSAARDRLRFAQDAGADRTAQPVKTAAKPVPTRAAGKTSEAAGRYSVFREGGKDTGCMVTLDDKAKVKGGDKASLAPGCRDQGIVIFDPVAWQIVNGRLVLTARKGHSTHLDQQPDGAWLKDPKEGKSLSLKKQ